MCGGPNQSCAKSIGDKCGQSEGEEVEGEKSYMIHIDYRLLLFFYKNDDFCLFIIVNTTTTTTSSVENGHFAD